MPCSAPFSPKSPLLAILLVALLVGPASLGWADAAADKTAAELAEKLFWGVLDHLGRLSPEFIRGKTRGRAHRFKAPIHIVDTTVIELVANAMDWAKHRRRKAAAKTHLRLNLQSLLPQCVIVDTAREHDNRRARELCAGLQAGEIVIFDKGYLDFGHLLDLGRRGVHWVTRAKENLRSSPYKDQFRELDREQRLYERL